MSNSSTSFALKAGRLILNVLWGLLKFIGFLLATALTNVASAGNDADDGDSQPRSSDRSVRIEVFNPNTRRWSFAGSCIASDAAVEGAMQRAIRQFSFASKARAVDAQSGSIVSFMEG